MSFTVQRRLQAILHHVCGMDPVPPSEKKVAPQDLGDETARRKKAEETLRAEKKRYRVRPRWVSVVHVRHAGQLFDPTR